MTNDTAQLSGLAAHIRSVTEGAETFDLAGLSGTTVATHLQRGLQSFEFTSPVRLTFVTGAGKLARQKYAPDLPVVVRQTLQSVGYVDERDAAAAAAAVVDENGSSKGTFKAQHDTGKNLKTIVVIPTVSSRTTNATQDTAADSSPSSSSSSLVIIPPGTTQHKLAHSSVETLRRFLPTACPTWSQKKAVVQALEEIMATVQEVEQLLVTGQVLTIAQQDLYDTVSVDGLRDKITLVREWMHQQVTVDGKLTMDERDLLLQQVEKKLKNNNNNNNNNTAVTANLQERRRLLQELQPIPPPPLSKQAAITKLRTERQIYASIDETTLLSVADTKRVARRDEIDAEIAQLEQASRGWYETDQAFAQRLALSRKVAVPPKSKKTTSTQSSSSSSSSSSGGTKWVTPSMSKPKGRLPASQRTTKKKTGGSLFSQMMLDSDSD